MLRQREVNGAIFHLPTVEPFTTVAQVLTITGRGVQLLQTFIANGEIAEVKSN